MPLVISSICAFVVTLALVPPIRRLARSFGLVAQPAADRWHEKAVPVVGGVAMFLPVLLVGVVTGAQSGTGPLLAAATLMSEPERQRYSSAGFTPRVGTDKHGRGECQYGC